MLFHPCYGLTLYSSVHIRVDPVQWPLLPDAVCSVVDGDMPSCVHCRVFTVAQYWQDTANVTLCHHAAYQSSQ